MAQWLFPPCNRAFKGTLRLFADLTVSGAENLSTAGPLIVASNHLSNLDPAIVASALPRNPQFLAKKELFSNPLFAMLLQGYGVHPVDRQRADLKAVNWAARKLRSGAVIILFPEGTRSRGEGLLRARLGVAHLAALTGAPVVPAALTGSEPLQNVLKAFRPAATMTLTFGRPFVVDASVRKADRRQLEEISTEIMVRIARMLPEEYRGHYRDVAGAPASLTVDAGGPATVTAAAS